MLDVSIMQTVTTVLSFCSLEDGGVPPKFVIIDDGWQSVGMDSSGIGYEADNAAK